MPSAGRSKINSRQHSYTHSLLLDFVIIADDNPLGYIPCNRDEAPKPQPHRQPPGYHFLASVKSLHSKMDYLRLKRTFQDMRDCLCACPKVLNCTSRDCVSKASHTVCLENSHTIIVIVFKTQLSSSDHISAMLLNCVKPHL